jgi:hypothetical protein
MRRRRGMTVIEVVMAAGMGVLVLVAAGMLVRLAHSTWYRSSAEDDATEVLQQAIRRFSPDVRAGLRVHSTKSSSSRLVVVLPKTGTDGKYVVPLADGAEVSFYLSDTTGALDKTGTILWRSVNSVPDTAWSLQGDEGRVDLGVASLAFTYYPSVTDARSVQVSVTTRQGDVNGCVSRSASTEIYLRNRSYQ